MRWCAAPRAFDESSRCGLFAFQQEIQSDKGKFSMNTSVLGGRQASNDPIQELQQILSRGQSQSRAALIDITTSKVAALGRGAALLPAPLIAAFARLIFAPQYSIPSALGGVRETIAQMGGVRMVAVLMRDQDLFLALMPDSSRAISLVIKHHNTSSTSSDVVLRGRAIRAKIDPSAKVHVTAEVEKQTEHSYSIWNSLIRGLISRFSWSQPGASVPTSLLPDVLSADEYVLAGDLFELKKGQCLSKYRAPHSSLLEGDEQATITALRELFAGNLDLRRALAPMGFTVNEFGKVQVQIGGLDFYWLRTPYFPALYLPFDPNQVLLLYKEPRPYPALDWVALDHAGLNLLRMRIGNLLARGLRTTVEPFPETQIEFQAILDELRALDPSDLVGRLDIGGFVTRPMDIGGVRQRCQECIYYLPNRQWCDLPELPVPVKPEWWCRLWKV